jgi:hypothetical protein
MKHGPMRVEFYVFSFSRVGIKIHSRLAGVWDWFRLLASFR